MKLSLPCFSKNSLLKQKHEDKAGRQQAQVNLGIGIIAQYF
jgi:hypothetical protein